MLLVYVYSIAFVIFCLHALLPCHQTMPLATGTVMHKEAVELDTCAAVSSEDLASEEEGEASKDWADLPPELLEAIGSSLSSTSQAANASIVCKTWRSNMTQGDLFQTPCR